MFYTVTQISKSTNLSRSCIYKKLKTDTFKEHITKKQGVTYLDEIGLDLIKNDIKTFDCKKTVAALDNEVALDAEYINYLKEDIAYMKSQNEKLWNELQEKNLQLNDLNTRLAMEQELNKNNQILQLRQPHISRQSEEHFRYLDNKLITIREQMQDRKLEQEGKRNSSKGFFNKLLKR